MKTKCGQIRLLYLAAILVVCIIPVASAVLPSLPASPVGYDVYGDGVDIYVPTNDTLGFRHESWTLYFTPTLGNWNGTSTVVFFNDTLGTLGFLAQENCTVQLSSDDPNIYITLNGVVLGYATPLLNFTAGNEYVFEWEWTHTLTTSYVLTFTSSPIIPSVEVTINGTAHSLPYTLVSVGAYDWAISVTSTLTYGGITYNFQSWLINSSTVTSSNTLNLANAGNSTFQANYVVGTVFIWPSGGTPLTLYFRNNVITSRSHMAYQLATDSSHNTVTTTQTTGGEHTCEFGFQAYIINYDNSTSEITLGVPAALFTLNTNGTGNYVRYWDLSASSTINNPFGIADALLIKVYSRWDSGAWILQGTFATDPDQLFTLASGTWTFSIYAGYTDIVTSTTSTFSWGDPSTQTSLMIYVSRPTSFELQQYYLYIGNLVGFTAAPFSFPIRLFDVNLGNTILFAFLLLIVDITLYIRTESWTAVSLITMLFCGSGGVATGMIPSLGLGLAWAGFAFGIAILLFKLVKGRSYGEYY